MVSFARQLAWTTLLAFGSAACVAVLNMDELHEGPADAASSDASIDADEDASCGLDRVKGVPEQPTNVPSPTDGGGKSGPLYFALDTIDMGINPDQDRPGFDLDHRVTHSIDDNSCIFPQGDRGYIESYGVDPPSGVDNATMKLLTTLGTASKSLSVDAINDRLKRGLFGVVIVLHDWNGMPDDADVRLQVIPSLGIEAPATPTDDAGPMTRGYATPTHTAADRWSPDKRFQPPNSVEQYSTQAWVSGGTLVARFLTLTLPVRPNETDPIPFDFELKNVWTSVKIATNESGEKFLESGTIGGRIDPVSIFRQIQYLPVDGYQGYFCSASQIMTFMVSQACVVRDIRSSYCDDNRNLPCDSLSAGTNFHAYRIDGLGEPKALTDADYVDAKVLPPSQRCTKPSEKSVLLECP